MRPGPLLLASLVACGLLPAREARPEPPPTMAVLGGALRGATLSPDGYFKWSPTEARGGLLGTLTGSTREFEEIPIEVGGDRSVFSSAARAAYEAQRIRFETERGEDAKVDLKGDLSVVRVRRFSGDTVYACATKQLGRATLFVRGWAEGKKEAGLVKLLQSAASSAKTTADEIDGWLPPEVKVAWNRVPAADLIVVEDGKVPEAQRDEILKAVRDAHAFVKRSLGGSPAAAFPPVVRITGSHDLLAHVTGRKDLSGEDAVYAEYAGELLVSPRGAKVDVAGIARAAVRQACHHLLGSADGEPIATGLSRMAEAIALGAPAGSLVPADEGLAFEAIKARHVRTWATILKVTGSFHAFFGTDADARGLEAELSTGYLVGSGAPLAKASLAKWVEAMRKTGHPDAASEAAYAPLDPAKSDAEFWAYWGPRADPPKKPGPGDKPPAKPPDKPPEKPPTKPKGK